MLQQQQLQNLIKKLTGCLVTSYNSNLWACERRIFNENLPSSYLNLSDENTPNLYDERVKEMISHELIKWLMSRIWQHSGNKQNIPPKSSLPSAFFDFFLINIAFQPFPYFLIPYSHPNRCSTMHLKPFLSFFVPLKLSAANISQFDLSPFFAAHFNAYKRGKELDKQLKHIVFHSSQEGAGCLLLCDFYVFN